MKQTMIDHAKTIAIIAGIILGIVIFALLIANFGEYIVALVMIGLVVYVIYAVYNGVLKDVKATRKRKEIANARKAEEQSV